jgi:outer membrane protein TolC
VNFERCTPKSVQILALCALSSALCFGQATPNAPAPTTPPQTTIAQQAQQEQQQTLAPVQPFRITLPHSRNPLARYRPSTVPPMVFSNSPRLYDLMRNGKLYISLEDAIALAIENNLDLAWFRYNFPIAQADLLNTQAGGVVGGVDTNIASATLSTAGSSGGGAPANLAAAGAGGIVTTALGAGASLPSGGFDPYLSFQGLVDHTRSQQFNIFEVGTPVLENNTIEAIGSFSQSFPLGTNLYVQYYGQRITSNSPYDVVNPELYANFKAEITQPLLAGFGLGSNERYIRIARRNLGITNYAFKAQVIYTVSGIEDLYWNLVDAYEDVQIREHSVDFEKQTLADDQKQFQLHAIPQLQVMQDETALASSEGDLTVARANLQQDELNIKNALTKTDDPYIDAMPVVPIEFKGPPDPNASKPIAQLIAEAEQNRPEVYIYRQEAEIQRANLRSVNSQLLPTLNMYGFYEGAGLGGPKNSYCDLGTVNGVSECATDLPAGFGGMFENTFNYSSPEYQVGMTLNINLRNRSNKAEQFRAVLQYRQSQINYDEQTKQIRFSVRNTQFALEQANARVQDAQQARDLAQRTFDITKQEQQLGAKSSYDVLVAENALAQAEASFDDAQSAFEIAKVALDQAVGETLQITGVSVDDAKSGIVTHMP